MDSDFRILILEDNAADAELAEFTLKKAGLSFTSCKVSTESGYINAIKEFAPDIILSDYELSLFNGSQALKIARERCPEVPFILFTGAIGEERAIEILTGGATDYVMKSRMSRLVPAVERALKEADACKKRKAAEAERDLLFQQLESRVRERTSELQEEIERRKGAEVKLKWLASFPERNPNPVLELELDNLNISYMNPAGRRLFPDLQTRGMDHPLMAGLPSAMQELISNELIPVQTEAVVDGKTYALIVIMIPESRRIRVYTMDHTERKRAERAKLKSEAQYRSLVDSSPDAVIVHRAGKFIYANKAAMNLYGVQTLKELQKNTVLDWVHPDYRETVSERIKQLESGQSLELREIALVRLDGRAIPVEAVAGMVIDFEGQPAIQVTMRDITERKLAEQKLKESEKRFRNYFESPTAGMAMTSPDKKWIEVNDRLCSMLGYSREELAQMTWAEMTHPDDLAADVTEFNRVISGEIDTYSMDKRFIQKGGEVLWTNLSVGCLRNPDGSVKQFAASLLDITDRKKAEYGLQQAINLSSALNKISTALYSNLNTSEILKILVEEGAKALKCESAGIALYKKGTLTLSYVYGFPDSYVGMVLTKDESPHGLLALRTGQPVVIRDAFNDEGVNREHLKEHNIRSVLVMPLIVMNEPMGVLFLNNQDSPNPFTETQVNFARQLATTAAIALKNSRLVEELNNFIAALEESERRLKLAITSTDIGVYDINMITRERKWDDQVMKLWGLPPGYQLTEETFFAGIHPDDLQRIKAAYQLAIDAGGSGHYEDEYRVIGIQDGIERWVSVHGQVYFKEGTPVRILGTAIDITDKKNIELALRKSRDELEERVKERTRELSSMADELRKSEEAYRLLVELNPVGVFRLVYNPVTRKIKRLHCNDAQLRVLGYSSLDEYLKDNPANMMRFKEDWNLYIGTLIHEGKIVNFPVQMVQKDNSTIWVLLNATAREYGQELLIEGAMTDIGSQKRVEERLRQARKQLRAMASEIVLADERSRQHFATDLHDTVVQTLGAAKLRAQLIQDQIPEKAQPIFSELQDMVSQSITQSRLIMSEMSPPVLYELGFIPALEWLTEQIHSRHNISVDFKTKARVLPLVHEIQVLLFQATRELLMNVVKHAKADSVIVKISSPGEKVRIEVNDNGKGFDKRLVYRSDMQSGGFGLFSIRERLKHLGGILSIRSKKGKGTVVIMTVPRTISE